MDKFYTSKEEIVSTIQERKKDDRLRNEIIKFYVSEIGIEPPTEINGSYCVLARHLPVNRRETLFANSLANAIGIPLLVPSYVKDRFVTCSKEKLSFLKPHFEGEDRPIKLMSGKQINQFDKNRNTIEEIRLPNGISLYDYHRNITKNCLNGSVVTFDMADKFGGKKAPEYYAAYLAMFGGLNCLLEDYHGGESGAALKRFTQNVFEPAFEKVQSALGINPLIFQLPWYDGFEKYVNCPDLTSNIVDEYGKQITLGQKG